MLFLLRSLRITGWLMLASSAGIVLFITAYEVAAGAAEYSLWPGDRAIRLMAVSTAMAGAAAVIAVLLSFPATIALVTLPRPSHLRSIVRSLTILPLISMPAIFAYAWILVTSSPNAALQWLVQRLGLSASDQLTAQSAFILALWLWPIPALFLTVSFRRAGIAAYQLASLDAHPVRAFVSAVLPAMRGPLLAATIMVFILALIDSTIAPLLNASNCWAVEMLAQAAVAGRENRPVAYLFWQAWPILAVVALAILAAIPGLRQMEAWAGESSTADIGSWVRASPATAIAAAAFTVIITSAPILIFSLELGTGRYTVGEAIASAWQTLRTAGFASLIVSICTAVAAMTVALLSMEYPPTSRIARFLPRAALLILLATALLPAEITGTALISFCTRICDPRTWNIYDDTPAAWCAAMLARFGFIAAAAAWIASRQLPRELLDAARLEGADHLRSQVYVQLPLLWPSLASAAIVTGCLTLSEVGASVLVQPTRFGGGSLAVAIDSQMHYGRQNVTIAASLLMIIPAFTAAALAPVFHRRTLR